MTKKKILTYKETRFLALFNKDPLEPFKFPFWSSIILTCLLIMYRIAYNDSIFIDNILNEAGSILAIAISSMGLILAALALVLVIFSKEIMHHATVDGVFQEFLLPYYIGALSWTILSLVCLFQLVTTGAQILKSVDIFEDILGFTLIFQLIYSILYTIRIIGNVITYTLLSAHEDYEE